MLLIDFLYNINFSIFRNFPERGRWVAVAWLSSSLTFIFFGLLFFIFHQLFHFNFFRSLPALFDGASLFLCYAIFFYILKTIYIEKQRHAGEIRYPVLYALLIPVLGFGSLGLFIYTADNFG